MASKLVRIGILVFGILVCIIGGLTCGLGGIIAGDVNQIAQIFIIIIGVLDRKSVV